MTGKGLAVNQNKQATNQPTNPDTICDYIYIYIYTHSGGSQNSPLPLPPRVTDIIRLTGR